MTDQPGTQRTPGTDVFRMEAGRELDALVAEKVMGWDIKVRPEWGSRIVSGPFKDCDCVSHDEATVVPSFSTDIAEAWLVLEATAKHMTAEVVRHGAIRHLNGDWTCCFSEQIRGGRLICGDAPSAPLAICRAALLAIGADK